jgi:hypothetical protein
LENVHHCQSEHPPRKITIVSLSSQHFGVLILEGQRGQYHPLASHCAHGADCLQLGTLLMPRQRHVGVVRQDGCHPGTGLWPLLQAVLTVRVPMYSSAQPQLPSAASARLRALSPLMPSLHQHPRLPVLGSFAGGTWSLLSVLLLPSGVDCTRCHQSSLLFPMG